MVLAQSRVITKFPFWMPKEAVKSTSPKYHHCHRICTNNIPPAVDNEVIVDSTGALNLMRTGALRHNRCRCNRT